MKRHIILSLLLASIYFITWMVLAFPYRLFPSNDDYFYSFVADANIRSVISNIVNSYHPVTLFSLTISKMIWGLVSNDMLSTLLFHAVASNFIVIFLLGIIVFMITRNTLAVVMALILYATSGWPANYYFFYSYAPFAAMLSLLALFFILKAYVTLEKRDFFIAVSGIISGLYFWSYPGAMAMVGLYFLSFLYLFQPISQRDYRRSTFIYLIVFICTIAPFTVHSTGGLISYIGDNFSSFTSISELVKPITKSGHIVKTPFFSFFHILWVYNPILLISFFIVSILFIAGIIIKKRTLQEKIIFSAQDKILFSLMAIVWLHSLIIDILPFTKLGRAHLVVYPIFVIVTVGMFYFLIPRLSYRYRRYLYLTSSILFILIIFVNIKFCSELIRVKQYIPRYLKSHLPQAQLYISEEDSHADYIMAWLEDFRIQKIKKSELDSVLLKDKKGTLIIGPNGIGSGLSILSNACLDDFFIEDLNTHPALKKMKKIALPYFAYFPSFLLEEETCEALYFFGRRVNYKSDSKNITLFAWGDEK